MPRIIPFMVGLLVVLVSGFVHGLWTDRWQLSNEPAASVAKLPSQDQPMKLGEWESAPGRLLDEQELIIGEIAGYFNHTFINRRTKHALQVLVLCGRPGPIAVHAPEVCLGGEGFALVRPKVKYQVQAGPPAKQVEFWVGDFQGSDAGLPLYRRQLWTYSPDGNWTAEDNPRFAFARSAALYKIYIVHQASRGDEKLEDDPALDFIRVFMPALQKHLFPKPAEP